MLQVYSNFMKYQLSEYVKSQGMDLESLTTKELEDMESAMLSDIYPGQIRLIICLQSLQSTFSTE